MVMGWHMFNFYDGDPTVIRWALFVSFDIIVFVLFDALNDSFIKKHKTGVRLLWIGIGLILTFQLVVNVMAYSHESNFAKAFLKGSIFPVLVGILVYIGTIRNGEVEKAEVKKAVSDLKKSEPIFEQKFSKEEILTDWNNGMDRAEIMKKHNISKTSLYRLIPAGTDRK